MRQEGKGRWGGAVESMETDREEEAVAGDLLQL